MWGTNNLLEFSQTWPYTNTWVEKGQGVRISPALSLAKRIRILTVAEYIEEYYPSSLPSPVSRGWIAYLIGNITDNPEGIACGDLRSIGEFRVFQDSVNTENLIWPSSKKRVAYQQVQSVLSSINERNPLTPLLYCALATDSRSEYASSEAYARTRLYPGRSIRTADK